VNIVHNKTYFSTKYTITSVVMSGSYVFTGIIDIIKTNTCLTASFQG